MYLPDAEYVFSRIHSGQGQSTITHLLGPESKIYIRRLSTILLKLDAGEELVRMLARNQFKHGIQEGGYSALKVLEDNNICGLSNIQIALCKLYGKGRQHMRTIYHRVAHGIKR